jgi:hypothetical protein
MRNRADQSAAELSARWPGWSVWYVPRATGKPVVTWHARRKDGTGDVLHAEFADELDEAIEQAER